MSAGFVLRRFADLWRRFRRRARSGAAVLAEFGVRQVFHKVNLKPGKPLWFGLRDAMAGERSSLACRATPSARWSVLSCSCGRRFRRCAACRPLGCREQQAKLTVDHQQRGERPTYWPAALTSDDVTPLPWKGSGDLRTLADANCLALFPAGDRCSAQGKKWKCCISAAD